MKRTIISIIFTMATSGNLHAQNMQHGFIIANDNNFASHLVASGHHSQQTNVQGTLTFKNRSDEEKYQTLKQENGQGAYFLLQAQFIDLNEISCGTILSGPIVMAPVGEYLPDAIVIPEAEFKVDRVLLNIKNPFFDNNSHAKSTSHAAANMLISNNRKDDPITCRTVCRPPTQRAETTAKQFVVKNMRGLFITAMGVSFYPAGSVFDSI